jgi:hypothetical protein
VKRGDADALRLLGLGHAPAVTVQDVRFEPATVPLGGRVRVTFSLRSTAREAQDLLVNLAVHFVKARGGPRPKVFKVARRSLSARGRVELHTELSLAMHTTRTPRPGTHAVDVVVNGVPLRAGTFEVTDEVRSASTAAPQAATPGTRLSVDDSPLDLETQ